MKFKTILAAAALGVAAGASAQSPSPDPLVVTRGIDDGLIGSLRYAINYATSRDGSCLRPNSAITFAGPMIVSPTEPLPLLDCGVKIDGGGTPNSVVDSFAPNVGRDGRTNATIVVEIEGSSCQPPPAQLVAPGGGAKVLGTCNGLEAVGDAVVRNVAIHSFGADGVAVYSGFVQLYGNFIGTNASGTASGMGNAGHGVRVAGGQLYAGGSIDTPADRNLISGNAMAGIFVEDAATDVDLSNNLIGGNRDGGNALPNGSGGVVIEGSSVIDMELSRNFIRFNGGPGVSSSRNRIELSQNVITDNPGKGMFYASPPFDPPLIESYTFDGTNTTLTLSASSATAPFSAVEVFSNPGYSLSNLPLFAPFGGQVFAGSNSSSIVGTDGLRRWTVTVPGEVSFPTATLTMNCDCVASPTSEYSFPAFPPLAEIFPSEAINAGGQTDINIIVFNLNPQVMNGVEFTYTLPSDVTLVGAVTYEGECGTSSITPLADGVKVTNLTLSGDGSATSASGMCQIHLPVTSSVPGLRSPGNLSAVKSSLGVGGSIASIGLVVTQPIPVASPSSVDFGDVAVGTTAGPMVVTIGNIGNGDYRISGVAVTGTGFTLSAENCSGRSITPAFSELSTSCTVSVSFAPNSAGAFSGQLQITSPDQPSFTVPLAGQGVRPVLQVTPSSFDFGNVLLGQAPTTDITIANTGNATLNLTSIALSTPPSAVVFTQATSPTPCGAALSAGASCIVRVKFAPAAPSVYSGALNIASNDPANGTVTVPLLGKGSAQAPSVSPSSIAFGGVPIGGNSIIPVTVTNSSPVALSFIFRVTGTGFTFVPSVPTLCPSPLPPGATCSVAVKFAPTTAGAFTGALEVDGGSSTTPSIVNVTLGGTGVSTGLPVASLSPGSLTFTAQTVGTTSPAQVVVLSNGGTLLLDITSIAIAGDFGYTGCGFPLTLAPGASCTFSVTFSPIANGTRTGSITITDNAAGSPHVVNLVGTGANGPQPSIEVRPFALDFGDVRVGVQHSDVVTITSNGTAPLAISSISIAGPGFTQSNTCPASLPVGGSCQVTVSFVPAATGPYGSTMTIASNADPGNFNVSLAGNGVPTPPAILTVDRFVDFGQQTIGTTTRLSLELRNTGEQALSVNALDLRGAAFGIEGSCAAIVPGGACTVTLVFTPPSIAVFTGSLTIASNDARGAIRVDILGEGVALPRPEIELSVDGIGFANQFITTQSPSQTVSVRSVGSAPLQIHGVSVTGPFVLTGNGCPGTLASGAHCDVSVAFLPFAPGVGQGVLTVDSDAEAGRGFASLTGTGCRFFTIAGLRTLQPLCQ